jgi:alpha-tubulin suppressor-like RCC1 family protein
VTRDGKLECWGFTSEPNADEHHDDYELYPPPSGTFTDVTVGLGHNCALRPDQTAVCWGVDDSGQVGSVGTDYTDKVTEPPPEHDRSKMPQARAGSTDIAGTAYATLTIGYENACAVRRNDGGLDCWGEGTDPSVEAEGGTYDYDRAYPSDGAYTDVVAGEYHACGLRRDGWVDCWGKGVNTVYNGMSEYNQAAPKAGKFSQIDSGSNHVCGIRPDGTIDCWGRGYTTEAGSKWGGRGETEEASPPEGRFVALESSGDHNCAQEPDDTITCWTLKTKYDRQPLRPPADVPMSSFDISWEGGCGLISDGTPVCWGDAPSPPDQRFTRIAVGREHACGLRSNGRIECWGDNDAGETIVPRGKFKAVFARHRSSCALTAADETVQCWGGSHDKLTPPGSGPSQRPLTAGQRVGLSGVPVDVAVGRHHTCARMKSGSVRCWGGNDDGQLGVGDTNERKSPAKVQTLDDVTDITAGDNHTCANTADGTLYCWGTNTMRQLGLGNRSTTHMQTPAQVTTTLDLASQDEAALAAAADHTCLKDEKGRLHCWGANQSGQIGIGRLGHQATPVEVPMLSDVQDVALDKELTCALRQQDDIFCWGTATSRAFGAEPYEGDLSRFYLSSLPSLPGPTDRQSLSLPTLVRDALPADRLVVAKNSLCMLTAPSTVTCQGKLQGRYDFSDILGDTEWPSDGGVAGSPLRRRYKDKTDVVDLSAGRNHVCAVLAVGRVFCWGGNRLGQLGTGDTRPTETPVRVDNVRLARDVFAGPSHTCVLTHRNGLKCWGDNRYFQLGRTDQ